MKHIVFACIFWIAHTSMALADAPVEERADEIVQIRDKLQAIEIDLARLGAVNDELGAVRREMSDALMQISNFLAVADRTLDAATASISAADAATNASQSYLTYTAILLAAFSLIIALFGFWATTDTLSRTATQLVKKLKLGGRNGESPIIDEIIQIIRNDLYQDASETVVFAMQKAEFRQNLKDLVHKAVKDEIQRDKENNNTSTPEKLEFGSP